MDVENCRIIQIYNENIDSTAKEVCEEVKTVLDRLQLKSDINSDQVFDIKVILCELLQNAIEHGNDCDTGKKIFLEVWLQDNSDVLGITVRDQGCGFDICNINTVKSCQIQECDPMGMSESGRGLFIVQSLCDRMDFNASGNAITVRKKIK